MGFKCIEKQPLGEKLRPQNERLQRRPFILRPGRALQHAPAGTPQRACQRLGPIAHQRAKTVKHTLR